MMWAGERVVIRQQANPAGLKVSELAGPIPVNPILFIAILAGVFGLLASERFPKVKLKFQTWRRERELHRAVRASVSKINTIFKLRFEAEGGNGGFVSDVAGNWRFKSTESWVRVTPPKGSGPISFTLVVKRNKTKKGRLAVIYPLDVQGVPPLLVIQKPSS
jgi:hypothetical protein